MSILPRLVSLFALTAIAQAHLLFPSMAMAAMAPTDKQMVMLKATGPRWGGTEGAFTTHAISLMGAQGNAIWTDRDPDHVVLVNPENKTYLVRTMTDYSNDIGKRLKKQVEPKLINKPIKLSDGTEAVETTIVSISENGRQAPIQKMVSVKTVVLPDKVARAWAQIMDSPLESGFIVTLARLQHHQHRIYQSESGDNQPSWQNLVEYRALKLMPLQAQRFIVPSDYKRAADETAFYFSSNGDPLKKSDIDDLFISGPKKF